LVQRRPEKQQQQQQQQQQICCRLIKNYFPTKSYALGVKMSVVNAALKNFI